MKANISRVICLVLCLLMAVTMFAACKKKTTDDTSSLDEVSSEDLATDAAALEYYSVATDESNTYVLKVLNEDGTTTLEVLEGTTIEQFFKVVTPTTGYSLKIVGADDAVIADVATVITGDMKMGIYLPDTTGTGEDTLLESVVLTVKSQAEFEEDKKAEEEKNDTTAAAKDGSGKAKVQTVLAGTTFTLGSENAGKYTENSDAGKLYQKQIANIESTYGCTVNMVDYGADADVVVKEVQSGNCASDVIELPLETLRNVARTGCCANIYSSSIIDKNAYGTGITDACTYGSNTYGVAFSAMSTVPMGVIYNQYIVSQYAPSYDIASLYDSKQWTFDAFEAVAAACTQDTNGDGATDIYGFTSNTNIIGMAITSNAGGTALKNSSGTIEATMCTDAGIKALTWCKKMFQARYWLYNSTIENSVNDFAAGKAAMFVSDMAFYGTIGASASFEMGFVMMPIGPDKSDYITGTYGGQAFMVPKNKEATMENSVLFLNALASVSGKLITSTMSNMKRAGLDTHSASVYKYAISHTVAEFRTGAIDDEVSQKVDTSVISKSKDPATVIAEVKNSVQNQLNDFYGKMY